MNSTNVISILSRSQVAGIDAATGALQRHTNALQTALNVAASAGRAAYGAAANIAGIGGALVTAFTGASINAAAQFQEQLAIINTIARTTPEALGAIGDEIRQLAARTGEPLDTLTKGFYDLLSAGIAGGDAMGVLEAASTLAIGGLATTAQTVDLLTTAINAWGLGAKDATRISDAFAVAIDKGKVTADQIAGSLFNVAPLAAQMGVGIEQVAAAYATMTAQGIPAEQLTVAMRSALLSLQAPTKLLTQAENALGVSFKEIARERGLHEAMRLLVQYSEDADIPLYKLLGRVEALQYAYAVSGAGASLFNEALTATTAGFEGNGYAALQAAERMNTLPRALGQLRASVADLMIEWGDAFLPGVTAGVQMITGLIQGITAWMRVNRELVRSWAPVISLVSGIFALRTGMQGVMLLFGRFLPLLGGSGRGFALVGTALTRLAFPLGLLVLGWNLLDRAIRGNWAGLGRYRLTLAQLGNVFSSVGDTIKVVAGVIGDVFRALLSGDFGRVGAVWENGLIQIQTRVAGLSRTWDRFLRMVYEGLRGPLRVALTWLATFLAGTLGTSTGKIMVAFSRFADLIRDLFGAVGRLLSVLPTLGRILVDVAGEAFRILAPLAALIGGALLIGLTKLIDLTAQFVTWLGGTSDGAAAARTWLGRLLAAYIGFLAVRRVVGILSDFASSVLGVARTARDGVASVIDFARAMGRVVSKAISLTVNGATAAYDAIAAVVGAMKSVVSKTVSLTIAGAQRAAEVVSTVVEKLTSMKDKSVRLSISGVSGINEALDGLKIKLGEITGEGGTVKINAGSVAVGGGFDLVGGILQGLGIGVGVNAGKIAGGLMAIIKQVGPKLIAFAGPWGLIAAAIVGAIALAVANPRMVGTLAAAFVNLLLLVVNGLILGAQFVSMLGSLFLTGIGEAIAWVGGRIGEIGTWFSDLLSKIDIDLFGFIDLEGLWSAISTPFHDVGSRFVKLWTEFWSGNLDWGAIAAELAGLGASLVSLPIDLVLNVGGWLLGKFGDLFTWVGERLGDAGGWIATFVAGIPASIGEWIGSVDWGAPFASIGQLISDALPDIDLGAWWDEVVGGFVENLGTGLWGPDSPLGQFIAWLGANVGPALEGFSVWWNELWTGVGSFIGMVWDGIVNIVGIAVSRLLIPLEILLEVLDDLPGPLQGTLGDAKDSIQGAIRDMEGWGTATDSAADAIVESWKEASKGPGSLTDAMKDAVVKADAERVNLNNVNKIMQSDAYAVWRAMETQAYTSGKNIPLALKKGMDEAAGSVYAAAAAIGAGVAGNLRIESEPPFASSPLHGITNWGGNIVKTIADGMRRALAFASAAAGDVGMALTPGIAMAPIGALPGGALEMASHSARNDGTMTIAQMEELIEEARLQNEQLAVLAANDPAAAGPLPARGTLEQLRWVGSSRRGPRR